jgi:hypothetical protein
MESRVTVGASHRIGLCGRLGRRYARLAKDTLTHCRQAGRAVSGPTTFWDVGLEIRRVADTQPLLVEPPAEGL